MFLKNPRTPSIIDASSTSSSLLTGVEGERQVRGHANGSDGLHEPPTRSLHRFHFDRANVRFAAGVRVPQTVLKDRLARVKREVGSRLETAIEGRAGGGGGRRGVVTGRPSNNNRGSHRTHARTHDTTRRLTQPHRCPAGRQSGAGSVRTAPPSGCRGLACGCAAPIAGSRVPGQEGGER